MNGRIQRIVFLLRFVGGAGLAVLAGWYWGAWAAACVLLLVIAGPGLVMLPSFLILRFIPPAPGLPVVPVRDLMHAWWREVVVVTRVFNWQQPWFEHREPDYLPRDGAPRRGVLLLHGYSCNRALWNVWMRALRARGVPFMALTMEPAFGSIDLYAPAIDQAMRQLHAVTGRAPLIVAHSMGGLCARAWWRSQGHPLDRIHRMLTLGTPHHGTLLAKLGTTANARQMRGDSEWLYQLAQDEAGRIGDHFDCLYGHCDQVVFPAETAVLPGSRVLHLPARGHLQLVFEPQAFARAMALLDEAPISEEIAHDVEASAQAPRAHEAQT